MPWKCSEIALELLWMISGALLVVAGLGRTFFETLWDSLRILFGFFQLTNQDRDEGGWTLTWMQLHNTGLKAELTNTTKPKNGTRWKAHERMDEMLILQSFFHSSSSSSSSSSSASSTAATAASSTTPLRLVDPSPTAHSGALWPQSDLKRNRQSQESERKKKATNERRRWNFHLFWNKKGKWRIISKRKRERKREEMIKYLLRLPGTPQVEG